MLLFIPLRLGLSDINPIYFKSIKTSFRIKHTLGIIGGRPNQALYFVGCVGNELVYLDPHTVQQATDVDALSKNMDTVDDSSYHCEYASRVDLNQVDPSIALCFFCASESDFDSWCSLVHKSLIVNEKQPLFELSKDRPHHWPPLINPSDDSENQPLNSCYDGGEYDFACSARCMSPPTSPDQVKESFTLLAENNDHLNDSDEEFEILG